MYVWLLLVLPSAAVADFWTAYVNVSRGNDAERSETARFAAGSPIVAAAGALVHLGHACDDESDVVYDGEDTWLALVERGNCSFTEKIVLAQNLNASGVIVYDTDDKSNSNRLETMKVDPDRVFIPAVFTYRWKGLQMRKMIEEQQQLWVMVAPGAHCATVNSNNEDNRDEDVGQLVYCSPPDAWTRLSQLIHERLLLANRGSGFLDFNFASGYPRRDGHVFGTHFQESRPPRLKTTSSSPPSSVVFVSACFVLLMVISLLWLVFYYVNRFRDSLANSQVERKLCSQAKRALSLISTETIRLECLEDGHEDTCAVCIDIFAHEDVVRRLPCQHVFHKTCIDQWLLEKRTCPMCKLNILKHFGMDQIV